MELDLIGMELFSHPSGGTSRTETTLEVDKSSSTKIDNRKNYVF